MTQDKIKLDVEQEFAVLRKNIEELLQGDFNIETQKDFLKNHIPSEIFVKSEMLLDTVLNYLMDVAVKKLDNYDIELQNDFFNHDFRNQIRGHLKQTENQLQLVPSQIEFSSDPRLKKGLIAGGITGVTGSVLTSFIAEKSKTTTIVSGATSVSYNPYLIGIAVVAGFATIGLTVLAFKKRFKKAELEARQIIKTDINDFINKAEHQVLEWLNNVVDVYSEEYNKFCNSHNIQITGGIK